MRAIGDTSWKAQGLCSQLPMDSPLWEQFFGDDDVDRRPARNYCGGCPVREQCLRAALEGKEIWGVWGGCDEADLRRALWVDANGDPCPRSRFPQCPSCKSRPNNLTVTTICELKSRRKRERIECRKCGFWWNSATSAVAVRAYWRERKRRLTAQSAAQRRLPVVSVAKTEHQLPAATPLAPELGMVAGGFVVPGDR
jgi:hypothetical protein